MEWSARILVPAVSAFVVLAAMVVVGILRVGGLIDQPAIWVVIVVFSVLVAPIVFVFISAMRQAEREDEDGGFWSWLVDGLPWM